ncbi:hypothetical protein JTT01_04490 [Clostridium botulinum]|nr:hypothetical protein [Clostridium botulinum]MCS4463779.1 hypothetical protein [Clostridium botulinum]MCS4525722.1 hypothetical protein [Clostridium botulinum]
MNLKELVEIALIKCSKLVRMEGKKIYKSGLVFDIKSKKIDNVYNIYGKVKNENKSNDYYTHIRINMPKGILEKLNVVVMILLRTLFIRKNFYVHIL